MLKLVYINIHFKILRRYNILVILTYRRISVIFLYLNLFTSKCLNLWQTNIMFSLIIFSILGNKWSKIMLFLLCHAYPGDSLCLIIPIFFNQVCTPTNWRDDLAMEMLPNTCMPLVWPILLLLGTTWNGHIWLRSIHFLLTAAEPCSFGRQDISLQIESLHTDQIHSCLLFPI